MVLTIRPSCIRSTRLASSATSGSWVLATTVTTMDTSGREVRRLLERYAVTLTTATGGRFEIPDPDNPTAWRTQQVFELREIR